MKISVRKDWPDWWTESCESFPQDKVSADVNEHWGRMMVSIPKETMLGASVVDKEHGQASVQGRQFAECKKPPGTCTKLDD